MPRPKLERLHSLFRSESNTLPQIHVMSPPTTPIRAHRESRDTGFPDGFDGVGNTTRPHPDADLSPNATISHDDIMLGMASKRRRNSFLTKHRRTVSSSGHHHNYCSPQNEAVRGVLALTLGGNMDPDWTARRRAAAAAAEDTVAVSSPVSPRFSKDGSDDAGWKGGDDSAPSSPSSGGHGYPRRRSIFGKWRRQ